jgi:hypothetical protein
VAVRLTPGASRDEVVGPRGDALAVRVSAPPIEGRANERLRKLLAKACRVPAGRVRLVRGQKGRDKLVRIEGLPAAEAARRVG